MRLRSLDNNNIVQLVYNAMPRKNLRARGAVQHQHQYDNKERKKDDRLGGGGGAGASTRESEQQGLYDVCNGDTIMRECSPYGFYCDTVVGESRRH